MLRLPRVALVVLAFAGWSGCRDSAWEEIHAARPQWSQGTKSDPGLSPISIKTLFPSSATVGVPFQIQPDGSSALGVAGSGFTRTSVIYFDERPMITNYQSPRALAAIVPNDLLAKPWKLKVTVRDLQPAPRRSEPAVFEIHNPTRTPIARVRKPLPSSAE